MASTTVAYHSGLTYAVGVDTPSGEAHSIAATGAKQLPVEVEPMTTRAINFPS